MSQGNLVPSVDEKNLVVVAQRAFEDGFYDVALRYIGQVLKDFPQTDKYIDIKLLQGQCYFLKKEYLKAIDIFKELLNQSIYQDVTLFWLGEVYLKKGDFLQAQKQYKKLIEEHPTSVYIPQAYYSMGWVYFESDDYEESRDVFQYIVDHFSSNNLAEDALFKVGECSYNLGEYERAVFSFDLYLKSYPSSPRQYEALFNIAESYYYCDQYEQAVIFYEKAKQMAQTSEYIDVCLLGQAWSFLKLNQEEESLKVFDVLIVESQQKGQMNTEALIGKASLFVHVGKYRQAIDVYAQMIDEKEKISSMKKAEAFLGRANVYFLSDNYDDAIKDYQTMIDLYQKDALFENIVQQAKFSLAWVYVKAKKPQEAKNILWEVFHRTKEDVLKVKALIQIGDIEQEASHFDEAIKAYQKVLKDFSSHKDIDLAWYRLGVCLLKAGRIDEGLDVFIKLRTDFSSSQYLTGVFYYTGAAYFKKKMWLETVNVLNVFLQKEYQKNEFVLESKYTLALALFYLKEYGQALKILKNLIKEEGIRLDLMRMSLVYIAKIQYELGNVKEAIGVFKKVSYSYPHTEAQFDALLWLGQYYMSKKLYRQAEEQYVQILKENFEEGQLSLVYFELARLFQIQGDIEQAMQYYQKLKREHHEVLFWKTQLVMADILYQTSRVSEAVNILKEMITQQHPFTRDVYWKLGQCYALLNNIDDAKLSYTRALWALPGESTLKDEEIHFYLADFLEGHQRTDEAIHEYSVITTKYAQQTALIVKAYLRMARLYEHQENWEKALNIYQKIVNMNIDASKFAQERIEAIHQEQAQP